MANNIKEKLIILTIGTVAVSIVIGAISLFNFLAKVPEEKPAEIEELMKRLTNKALVFIVNQNGKLNWLEIEEKWGNLYPNESIFK